MSAESPAPRRLLVATHNAHKTTEFRQLLGPAWQVEDLTSRPGLTPPEETGATFEENAVLKARAALEVAGPGVAVLADDSGLEIDALDGRPGVFSARYAGPDADDAANRRKVLAEMEQYPEDRRSARFRCVLALVREGREPLTFSGSVEGRLLAEERGTGGFGYDSIFVPDGLRETFAELPPEEKNRLSHRARAAEALLEFLKNPANAW